MIILQFIINLSSLESGWEPHWQGASIQNQENFDNPGISGNASTILVEFVSAENVGMVGFRHSWQFWQICQNCKSAEIVEDIKALPELRICRKFLDSG